MLPQMLIGHVVGDYFLQTNWMAKNKGKESLKGWMAVSIHTIIYTLSVCFCMWLFDWYWIVTVFLSHIFIDHYSLGMWYMEKFKGMEVPKFTDSIHYTPLYWIIYVVIDNGAHLILMYGAYNLLY